MNDKQGKALIPGTSSLMHSSMKLTSSGMAHYLCTELLYKLLWALLVLRFLKHCDVKFGVRIRDVPDVLTLVMPSHYLAVSITLLAGTALTTLSIVDKSDFPRFRAT